MGGPINISAVEVLREALIQHRHTFLTNILANVYEHPPATLPDPGGNFDVDEWTGKKMCAESLCIDWLKTEILRNRKENSDEGPESYTTETFAEELIARFTYDGIRLRVADYDFESLHNGDMDRDYVETHWVILTDKEADAIQASAYDAAVVFAKAVKCFDPEEQGDLRARIEQAIWDGQPRWYPRVVRWQYLKDLDTIIRVVAERPQHEVTAAIEGEWSLPMSLTEMANRLGNMPPKKFKQIASEHWGLKELSRQKLQVRLDLMDKTTRHRIEYGRPPK